MKPDLYKKECDMFREHYAHIAKCIDLNICDCLLDMKLFHQNGLMYVLRMYSCGTVEVSVPTKSNKWERKEQKSIDEAFTYLDKITGLENAA